jgi:hypothetical protein
MRNSFSTLRDESDDVPLGAEFLCTDSATAGTSGGHAPRKRSRLRSPEGGLAGGSGQRVPRTKRTEKKETNRQATNGGHGIENIRDRVVNPNIAALRTALASFISSLNLPPLVNDILSAILAPLIDSLGPVLSSFISKIFPSMSSSPEAQNSRNNV